MRHLPPPATPAPCNATRRSGPSVILWLAAPLLLCACAVSGPVPPLPAEPGSQTLKAQLRDTAPEALPEGQCITQVSPETGGAYWFESLCDKAFTAEFTASLQRALAARGLYRGAIDGRRNAATSRAILAYQSERGLPSTTLSRLAAQQMGLIVWSDGR